jgi:hypothetical protein
MLGRINCFESMKVTVLVAMPLVLVFWEDRQAGSPAPLDRRGAWLRLPWRRAP